MATHKLHQSREVFYFVTFTCYRWLPLIERSDTYQSVYKWFHCAQKDVSVTGYAIMPNHVHVLLYLHRTAKNLSTIVGDGKRFIAYDIIKGLMQKKSHNLLQKLSAGVSPSKRKSGKKHRVFRSSFDAKICDTENDVVDVLDYIHGNPVSKGWSLVEDCTDYKHSSAAFYLRGREGLFPIVDYRDIC